MQIQLDDLHNESDVEQKVVLPLLTGPAPAGLGYSLPSIKTKPDIRQYKLGKGKEAKLYLPDYLVVVAGLPVLIVEVKGPGVDLTEAYREARLYAQELNASFPSGLNPVSRILCVNDGELWAGNADADTPAITLTSDRFDPADVDFDRLLGLLGHARLREWAHTEVAKLTPRPFTKPIKQLGGHSVRNEEVGQNTFGATLSLEYGHVFNPVTREDRAHVVRNAYVASERRERYVDPIDRLIRAATSPSEAVSTLVEDTEDPKELLGVLRKGKRVEHKVMLLIGSVGSGNPRLLTT